MSNGTVPIVRRWRLHQLARSAMKSPFHSVWTAAHQEMGRILHRQRQQPQQAPERAERPERDRRQARRRHLLQRLSPRQRRAQQQPVRHPETLTRMLSAAHAVQAHRVRPPLAHSGHARTPVPARMQIPHRHHQRRLHRNLQRRATAVRTPRVRGPRPRLRLGRR
jgi:hypothetical protein